MRRFSAIFLLVLFAFSLLPKKTLHDLVARHKDISLSLDGGGKPCYHLAGFMCHCDDLVVEFPFICGFSPVILNQAPDLATYRTDPDCSTCQAVENYHALRGPPAFS